MREASLDSVIVQQPLVPDSNAIAFRFHVGLAARGVKVPEERVIVDLTIRVAFKISKSTFTNYHNSSTRASRKANYSLPLRQLSVFASNEYSLVYLKC